MKISYSKDEVRKILEAKKHLDDAYQALNFPKSENLSYVKTELQRTLIKIKQSRILTEEDINIVMKW
jgi:hypothetical protein